MTLSQKLTALMRLKDAALTAAEAPGLVRVEKAGESLALTVQGLKPFVLTLISTKTTTEED